jgi:hypothetical protein
MTGRVAGRQQQPVRSVAEQVVVAFYKHEVAIFEWRPRRGRVVERTSRRGDRYRRRRRQPETLEAAPVKATTSSRATPSR